MANAWAPRRAPLMSRRGARLVRALTLTLTLSVALALSLWGPRPLWCAVDARQIVSHELSNTSVNAAFALTVQVDLEADALPSDGVVTVALSDRIALASSAAIDTALLAAHVDGSLQHSLLDQRLTVTRGGDGTAVAANTVLTFRLTGLTTPSRAGNVVLGSLLFGNTTHPLDVEMPLPSVLIQPGALWNSNVAFAHLISGRATEFTIRVAPANEVPVDGSLFIQLPMIYGNVSSVQLVSTQGMSGDPAVAASSEGLSIQWSPRSDGAGGAAAMGIMSLTLRGLQHPLLEGPLGKSIRVTTMDSDRMLIDQGSIDVSTLLLARAQVLLSRTDLFVRESDDTDVASASYTIQLSGPPEFAAGISVSIAVASTSPHLVTLEPSSVAFTQNNWNVPVTVTVRVGNDALVSSMADTLTLTHTIVEAASERSFAVVDSVSIHVEDDDFPLILLSRRHMAVVESLANDSYTIVLLSEPASDVQVVIESEVASLVTVVPTTLTFTASAWDIPQSVVLVAAAASPDTVSSQRSRILHHVVTSDANFDPVAGDVSVFMPQQALALYYEPLQMEACVEPCRAGWFPIVNTTTSISQCVACPLGSHCAGACESPVPCARGFASSQAFAVDASACQPCPSGSYANLEGMTACLPCPAGAACPTADAIYTPCPEGTFSSENAPSCRPCLVGSYNPGSFQDQCLPCPAGSFCPQGSIDPVPCSAGLYSVEGSTVTCAPCPAGYACPSQMIDPIACTAGFYSTPGEVICTSCPAGFACPDASQLPDECNPGTYSPGNVTECIPCPRGFACALPAAAPVACASGSYSSVEGAASCGTCPAGHSCVDPNVSPIACLAGSYSLEGDALCHLCPAGQRCADTSLAPQACEAGKYSLGSSIDCTPCAAGADCSRQDQAPTACPIGSFQNSSTCQLCDPGFHCPSVSLPPIQCLQGTYSLAGATECTSCPFGYTCSFPNSPEPCAIGETNNANHSACVPCPKGYDCSPLLLSPRRCTDGSYSIEGDSQCTPCPKGYACVIPTESPVRCSAGTYSPASSTACLACEPGFYCPQPTMDPVACPMWHYSEGSATACTPCPAGHDCTSPLVAPTPCPLGTYSLTQASSCLVCPAGTACPEPSALPVACPPGQFSVGGQAQCTPCTPGYYCPHADLNVQLACASGSYAEAGASVCTPCPVGKQCPLTTQKLEQLCEPGSFSLGGQAICTICPRGVQCPIADGSLNKACSLGWFAAGGAVACTRCPAGYACPDATSDSPVPCDPGYVSGPGVTECTPCAPGYACPDSKNAVTTQVACATGTYASAGAAACDPCPAGVQCLATNGSSVEECSPGWYSPLGTAGCLECPRGYYCDLADEMPKNCSLGSYSLRASTACTPCDPGYECPRSDQLPQPCPVGYYSEGAVANCRPCRPGYKCGMASTSSTPPEDACPMGGYCNPPTTFFLCPSGTYGNVTAGESVDHACAPCPEGYFCEMGATPLTQQLCPTGYYCPQGTKRGSQYPCPAGSFNPDPGQSSLTACRLCPEGEYCVSGTGTPSTCPHGYFCLEGTRASDQYPCPAGTYSGPQTGLTLSSQCSPCEIGSYCPEASSTPTPCPAGSYNPLTGSAGIHECLACPPGWACPQVGQYEYVDRCALGHYCPSGTAVATAHPCPAGTYTDSTELIRAEDCTICPLRHACPQGTGGETQTMLACGAGFFCPNGTAYAAQFPCLPGTWSASTSLAEASECEICPVGKYCSGGKSFIDGDCSAGHYCPLKTPSATKYPCPKGTFTAATWLFEPEQCDDCPPGHYCSTGSIAPVACKPGSYSSLNKTESVGPGQDFPQCITCPAGYYCEQASTSPQPCGKGLHSSAGAKACSPCEPGYFCNSATTSTSNMRAVVVSWQEPGALYGQCYNGTYCAVGSDSEPALATDACPAGYYCPVATPTPMICPAGTYSNLTGQDALSDCIPTPAGMYSLEGALQPTGPCVPGFYCPERSTTNTQVPCPARYYLDRSGGQSEEDCAVCPAGSFCPRGSAFPVSCPMGYYCRTGVATAEPCPVGTYANATGLRQVEDCLLCPPGLYCDATGLTVARGPCDPGYYCTLGSYTSAPMDFDLSELFGVSNRHIGGQCPPGAYCPLGSALPSLCPPGTFNNFTGLETETQCVSCSPGQFCETPGLLLPTGDCFAGFYCTGGASEPTQVTTPVGHYTLSGAAAPVPCPAGWFNLHAAQDQCVECPAGFYCGSPGTVEPVLCPRGSYCPLQTALPVKCEPGTFDPLEGLIERAQCEPCPAGQYCDSYGLVAPSGACFAGFICRGGSPVANPVQAVYGSVCPAGHFCPAGSGAGLQCPSGSYRATTGGVSLESCAPCPGGQYCGGSALIEPSGACSAGYYCTGNASSATPSGGECNNDLELGVGGAICPPGFFCPQGSSSPIKCPAGTFALSSGAPSCEPCPEAFYCDGIDTTRTFDCPAGFYCPAGTPATQMPCPIGSFSPATKLVNVSQCLSCLPGSYCGSAAMVAPAGLCAAGFFCPSSSQDPFGKTIENATHPCPAGSYCPPGTYVPLPCPIGSYSNTTMLTDASECLHCREGSYCDLPGLQAPTGLCAPGFFCRRNNSDPRPSGGVVTLANGLEMGGDSCPIGSYCALGSPEPVLCAEGTYSDQIGAVVCLLCPAGYYCPLGSHGYAAQECPVGYYCPQGTRFDVQYPCPPGSYGNVTGLQAVEQCLPAPGGMYVAGYAARSPTGYCTSGFYCTGGSTTGTPSVTTERGGPCLPGTNCPEGSAVPIVCDAGSYCSSSNTDQALQCDAGFYCVQGSYTATPTGQFNSLGIIGDVCPLGHYCPLGTSNPIPCPPGTYSNSTQNQFASDCFPCVPGFVCPGSGTVTPSEKCQPGFMCPGGEREATRPCPRGYACPLGTSDPQPCDGGTYSDVLGLPECKRCPERFYCEPSGCITPLVCPAGYVCPEATVWGTSYPCPPGTFSNQSALADPSECSLCPRGKYCNGEPPTDRPSGECAPGHYCTEGVVIPTPMGGEDMGIGGLCDGGYVCYGGAWLPSPSDNVTGQVCRPGFYCPSGSILQLRCPKGSYNAFEKQETCTVCPMGGYCDSNASAPVPCPQRYYCPQGTVEPVLCPSGTFGQETALESADQCAPCVAGKYCVAGSLTASCAAGYYCKMFNQDPNPNPLGIELSSSNFTNLDYGGPCPIGHYCPEGVLDPLPCPSGTARLTTHATSLDDCAPCPAGMSCQDGARTVACPAGFYCPYAGSATPCPAGTFNDVLGRVRVTDCEPCSAGKLCNATQIVDPSELDCPLGGYCPVGSSQALPCPPGRFRSTRGAQGVSDCAVCTGGSTCTQGAIEPSVCASKVYCPPGSGASLRCPGGHYCPYNTTTPIECPAGFFCALGVDEPTICSRGFYCPSGSTAPLACPLGYIGRETPLQGLVTALGDSCEACPAGTFGIDPNRTVCSICLPGYVCGVGTRAKYPVSKTEDNGYPCPTGHYCPEGSSIEQACPSGTYQPNRRAVNVTACLPCPSNTYQFNMGRGSCLPCSKSAYSAEGATKCTCTGSHRAFQMTDGYCICEPGYEFYDQDMILRSDEDDDVDCQPIVYDRCSSGQVRSDSGACESVSDTSCISSCPAGSGTYVSSIGLCQCDTQTDVDEVCDSLCRASALRVQVNSSTGTLQLYDPETGVVEPLTTSAQTVSKVACADGSSCQLQSLNIGSTGFSGSYAVPAQLTAPTSTRQRRLSTSAMTPTTPIENPMVCLGTGDGIFFDLSTPGSYPIYLKDSMLNTNPSFDYGAFRAVAARVKANTSSVTGFAFSFTEPGTYVLGNSLNAGARTVITVMKRGTTCPIDAPIVPMTEKNLISVSIKRRTDDMILAPDWMLILGLLGGLLGMVVSVIVGLYYFRTKSWRIPKPTRLGYRDASKHADLANVHSKGSVIKSGGQANSGENKNSGLIGAASLRGGGEDDAVAGTHGGGGGKGGAEYEPDLTRWGDDDLDMRELVDRLQHHHDAVAKCFDDQRGDVQRLVQHLQLEAAELKRLLVHAMVSGGSRNFEGHEPVESAIAATRVLHPEDETMLLVHATDDIPTSHPRQSSESVLVDSLERDLADRKRFRRRCRAGLQEASQLLETIVSWGSHPETAAAFARHLVADIADTATTKSPRPALDPESTMTAAREAIQGSGNGRNSHLAHMHGVLRDLQSLLGSTSSSLLHMQDTEKVRREVAGMVLEAAQHPSSQRCEADEKDPAARASSQLLALHERAVQAENKEDEALQEIMAPLQRYSGALPKLLTLLNGLEQDLTSQLRALQDEQNPSKERTVCAKMEKQVTEMLKELASSAARVRDASGAQRREGTQPETQRAGWLRRSELDAVGVEEELESALLAVRDDQRALATQRAAEQRQRQLEAEAERIKTRAEEEVMKEAVRPAAATILEDDGELQQSMLAQPQPQPQPQSQPQPRSQPQPQSERQPQATPPPSQQVVAWKDEILVQIKELLTTLAQQAGGVMNRVTGEPPRPVVSQLTTVGEKTKMALEKDDHRERRQEETKKEELLEPALAEEERERIRRCAEAEAQALVAHQEALKREYARTLAQEASQLSEDEAKRRMAEFEAGLANQTKHASTSDQEGSDQLDEASPDAALDAKYAEEEAAIEDAYRQEMSRLEEEFAALGDGDEALPESDPGALENEAFAEVQILPLSLLENEETTQEAHGGNEEGGREEEEEEEEEDLQFGDERNDIADGDTLQPTSALDGEVERIHQLHAQCMAAHVRSLDAEAARRQEQLRERLARQKKKKATEQQQQRQVVGVGGDTAQPTEEEEEDAWVRQEEEALLGLAAEMADARMKLERAFDDQETASQAVKARAIASHTAEVEAALLACRTAHARDAMALRYALAAERTRQERALQDRVTKKRQRRHDGEQVTSEHELEREEEGVNELERMERAALETQLVGEEQRAERQLQDALEEALRGIQAQRAHQLHAAVEGAEERRTLAEQELRRVQSEHERECFRLKEEMAVRQAAAKQRLRERLVQRGMPMSTEAEVEKLLAEETEKATTEGQAVMMELCANQQQRELAATWELSEATALVSALQDAELAMRDACQRELDRVWLELEAGERTRAEEGATALQAQQRSLRDRVAAQRQRRRMRQGQDEQAVTGKKDVVVVLDTALEIEKIKLQDELKQKKPSVAATDEDQQQQQEEQQLAHEMEARALACVGDVEALLLACQRSHDAEKGALRDALAMERRRQQMALRERLAQRRLEREHRGEAVLDAEEEEREITELDQALAQQESHAMLALTQAHDARQQALVEEAVAACHAQQKRAEADALDVEETRRRLEEEHARDLEALEASVAAERQVRAQRLRETLSAKRLHRRRGGGGDEKEESKGEEEGGKEEEDKMVARLLEEEIAEEMAKRKCVHAEAEEALGQRALMAVVEMGAMAVAVTALQAMTTETRGIIELAEMTDAGAVMEHALEEELRRVRAEHDAGVAKQLQTLRQDAELQKARVRERLARQRRHRADRGSSGGDEKEQMEEEAREMEEKLAAIEHAFTEAKQQVERIAAQEQADQERRTEATAVAHADEIEALLAACRERHAAEAEALTRRLELERRARHAALRDRLAAKRVARGSSGASAEAELVEEEEDKEEEEALRVELEDKQAEEERALHESFRESLAEATREVANRTVEQMEEAEHSQIDAQRELDRLQEEHERERAALRVALAAEERRQQLRLQESLAKRRAQRKLTEKATKEEEQTLEEEERNEQKALEEELDTRAEKALAAVRERQQEAEKRVRQQIQDAEMRRAALAAKTEAMEVARDAEAARVMAEFAVARGGAHATEEGDAQLARLRLRERLAEKKAKKKAEEDIAERKGRAEIREEWREETEEQGVEEQNQKGELARAMEQDLAAEVARIRALHEQASKDKLEQLRIDAERRKAALRDRMARKRANAAAKAGLAADGDGVASEQIEEEEERQAEEEEAIERELAVQEDEVQRAMASQCERVESLAREAADGHAAEMEELLEACRTRHARDAEQLKRTMAMERSRRELALQERLQRKRAERNMTTAPPVHAGGEGEQTNEEEEVQRAKEEDEEEARALAEELAAEEMFKLEEQAQRQQEERLRVVSELETSVSEKKNRAAAEQKAAEGELRRVREEHERERKALQSAMDAERQRQEARLQAKLAKRRALRKTAEGTTPAEEQQDEQEGQEEMRALAKELEARARRALEEAAETQRREEQECALRVEQAAIAVAAAEAARRAVEEQAALAEKQEEERQRRKRAEEEELARVTREHAAALQDRYVALEQEAARRRAQLSDRVARKRMAALAKKAEQDANKPGGENEAEAEAEARTVQIGDDAEDLKKKNREEEEELAQEEEEEVRRIAEELAAAKQRAARELAVAQAAEMEAMRTRALQTHELESRSLQQTLKIERQRQERALQQRVAAKRRAKQSKKEAAEEEEERKKKKNQEQEKEKEEEVKDRQSAMAEGEEEEEEDRKRKENTVAKEREKQARRKAVEKEEQEAMDAAREQEVARLAREFDETHRALEQGRRAELAAQKQKLAARMAAKKDKKLRELEEKRARERGELHARQEADQEHERKKAEEEAETKQNRARAEAEERKRRQAEADVAALQALVDAGDVPRRVTLKVAVEEVVGARHEEERARLREEQVQRSTHALQDALRDVMQAKATARAALEREEELNALEERFATLIREAEARALALIAEEQAAEVQVLRESQQGEQQALLTRFAAFDKEKEKVEEVDEEGYEEVEQVPRLRGERRRRRREEEEEEDAEEDELRLEADRQRQQLLTDKTSALQALLMQTQRQHGDVAAKYAALVADEQAAMERAFELRVRGLKEEGEETAEVVGVLHAEKDAQVARLVLMLSGRERIAHTRVTQAARREERALETEYTRKIALVGAMLRQGRATGEAGGGEVALAAGGGGGGGRIARGSFQAALEARLQAIEALLRLQKEGGGGEGDVVVKDYKAAVRHALLAAYPSLPPEELTLKEAEAADKDAERQRRLAFANGLLSLLTAPGERGALRRVVGVSEIPLSAENGEGEEGEGRWRLRDVCALDTTTESLQVAASALDVLSAGHVAVLVLFAAAATRARTSDVAHPAFFGAVSALLAAGYQNLFLQSEAAKAMTRAVEKPKDKEDERSKVIHKQELAEEKATADVAVASNSQRGGVAWQSHLHDMERFLAAMDLDQVPSEGPVQQCPSPGKSGRSLLTRQATTTVMAVASMAARARHSSRLLVGEHREGLGHGSSTRTNSVVDTELQALAVQEHRQFLQEKLDTAEKLYTHVLRQHEEQHETLVYLRELVAQAQDPDLDQDQDQDQGQDLDQDEARTAELRAQVGAAEMALRATRRERDELFAQCQALKDELLQLPAPRVATSADAEVGN